MLPSMPKAADRAGPEVIRVALICCSTQEGGLFTWPGQHSRVFTEGIGEGDLTLRTGKQENWPCSLFLVARGEIKIAVVVVVGCRRAHHGGENKEKLAS